MPRRMRADRAGRARAPHRRRCSTAAIGREGPARYSCLTTARRFGMAFDRVVPPGPSKLPLAFDRRARDPEHAGNLFGREAPEVLDLDDPALPPIELLHALQGFVPH